MAPGMAPSIVATPDKPSSWVQRFAALIGPGEVLDLACGRGRHARYLAALGHSVLAVDRDPEALQHAAGQQIMPMQFDLEGPGEPVDWPFGPARFAGIVVTNYLHRPLMAYLAHSLRPDGVLIYETFAHGNEQFGKPSNPDFLLAPGELLGIARQCGLRVLAFEDGCVGQPKAAMVQRLCALGPDFPAEKARIDAF